MATITLADLHPEKNERYAWTDVGAGRLFADAFKAVLRYVPERKLWYAYDGTVWRPDLGSCQTMERAKILSDQLLIYALSLEDSAVSEQYKAYALKWSRRQYRETVLKEASSIYPLQVRDFDRDPYLFNCPNGTLDLGTLEFREHRSSDFLTMVGGAEYDPKATCDRWTRFISEVMRGDSEKAVFLQKALGYSLSGDTSRECFFILYGATSRNGKGTCMESVLRVMGDYGRTAQPDTIAQRTATRGGAPSEDIARLAGARFVNISEPDKRMVLSSALVKTLTGNDTITARYLNENSFEFRPQFKLFTNTNHLPTVTDSTVFSSGRCMVVPFERHFGDHERDPGLKTELAKSENLSGILNWCIEGWRLFRELGLEPPSSVTAATAEYRLANDKVSRFIADEMEPGSGYEVQTSAAYARYTAWCGENGFQSGSIKTFNADVAGQLTVTRKRPRAGGEKTSVIIGHRLNSRYPDTVAR